MLLYIHVPFCRQKCRYCVFPSEVPAPDAERAVALYLGTLLQEITFWGERLGKASVQTVFFGGGTPSILPVKAVEGILDRVRATFSLVRHAEISMEANPESALAPGWLAGVKKAGVNRLSLGVQSLDDQRLRLLGRPHTAVEATAAFERARRAGFTNINLDFMWGLPGTDPEALGAARAVNMERLRPQSPRKWLRELEEAAALQPDHISAYGFTLEPDTPLDELHREGALLLPEEKVLASTYLAGAEYLESQGFMQYEISNFARMGFACRHNLGYWQGAEYLGIGPAAVSTLGEQRITNPENLHAWRTAVLARQQGANPLGTASLPNENAVPQKDTAILPQNAAAHSNETMTRHGEKIEALDHAARMKETLMLRLRTSKGLSLAEWKRLAGGSFLKDYAALVTPLQQQGLAASRQGYFRLTRTGMLVSNTILEHFFNALPPIFQAPGAPSKSDL